MDELQGQKVILDKEQIKKVPAVSGIYMFINKGKILYVGKSVNLKARLHSHLENAKVDRKEAKIINDSVEIEYFPTDSEFKALILEAKLIQTHRPKYNVRWIDDKSYLYIKITKRDNFPKIFLVRKEKDSRAVFFGPFPSVRSAHNLLHQIRKIFPFCSQKKIGHRPCFHSQIGLCKPCPNYIENLSDSALKQSLTKEYKYNIKQVIKILSGNLSSVEKSFRQELTSLTKQQEFEQALEVRNHFYEFRKLITQQLFDTQEFSNYNISAKALADLLQILHNYLPSVNNLSRIECYDISSLSQKEATGSMVVLTEGTADKSQYRKFKVKNPHIFSDFAMLEEVIKRRFKNKWTQPNLIVVDGGKPQVRTVLRTLAEIDKRVPVIGLAKNPDRIIIGGQNLPTIRPNIHRNGFNLLRFIRDESHRFAHKYHLYLRDKKFYNKR